MTSTSNAGPLDFRSETEQDEIGMFLKAKIGPSESQIELPKRFESQENNGAKIKGGIYSRHLTRSVNFSKSPQSKLMINSKKLTAVVVRHRPVATK